MNHLDFLSSLYIEGSRISGSNTQVWPLLWTDELCKVSPQNGRSTRLLQGLCAFLHEGYGHVGVSVHILRGSHHSPSGRPEWWNQRGRLIWNHNQYDFWTTGWKTEIIWRWTSSGRHPMLHCRRTSQQLYKYSLTTCDHKERMLYFMWRISTGQKVEVKTEIIYMDWLRFSYFIVEGWMKWVRELVGECCRWSRQWTNDFHYFHFLRRSSNGGHTWDGDTEVTENIGVSYF